MKQINKKLAQHCKYTVDTYGWKTFVKVACSTQDIKDNKKNISSSDSSACCCGSGSGSGSSKRGENNSSFLLNKN